MSLNRNVKFISYTGAFPNLCSGALTLEVNGRRYVFDTFETTFWRSGGMCYIDGNYDEHIEYGEWQIDKEYLPKELQEYADEIKTVFNENVPYGCCGGCI